MEIKTRKLLVLIDKYFPRPYANAMCAQELVRVLGKKYKVDILAYEDFDGMPCHWEGNNVYYVKPDMRLRLFYYADTFRNTMKGKVAYLGANILSKGKGGVLLPWQPFYSFAFPDRIYAKMCQLQEEKHYEGVISLLNPLDSNIAACKFKKKYPGIPYVVFCVDTLKKSFLQKYVGKEFADGFFWEKRILKKCDAYFYMASREKDYKLDRYDSYRDKLHKSDMPRFKIKDISQISPYDFGEAGESWVYAGSIGGPHYNPWETLKVFRQISKDSHRVLHMYTRGAAADQIKTLVQKENLNVRVHDYVDAATLKRIMATADVLVSIKTSAEVSAKIFECMSYGKPIVHFSGCQKDPDAYYLKKYTLGHVVQLYDRDRLGQIQSLEEFLKKSVGKREDLEKLLQTFKMSTPEYSAREIEKVIDQAKKSIT